MKLLPESTVEVQQFNYVKFFNDNPGKDAPKAIEVPPVQFLPNAGAKWYEDKPFVRKINMGPKQTFVTWITQINI
jgi:hypothetical protein